MQKYQADIIIFGAGIAGLWAFNRLRRAGYDVLLLEKNSIGGGQTIASQGIIHSGLKYALGGKVSRLAKSISAMPERWRAALRGDLAGAKVSAGSQYLLVPRGVMGGVVKLAAKKALGNSEELDPTQWPESLVESGFQGSVITMDEPVLDVPSVIRALAEPYRDSIRKIDDYAFEKDESGNIRAVKIGDAAIEAKIFIFTAAEANAENAKILGGKVEIQKRPLLMALMHEAPFELYAHLAGASDKPIATITTHRTEQGGLVWYIGGGVAERAKESSPFDTIGAATDALKKYLPGLNISAAQWGTVPIDRVEGKGMKGFLPDTPTLLTDGNVFYGWPTKLTFAPMLSDMIADKIKEEGIMPSGKESDWSFLPRAEYAKAPWDREWTDL